MHATILCQKQKPSSYENQVEEEGYKLADTSTDVTGECANSHVSKWQWTDSLCHQTASTWLDKILTSSEKQCQEHHQHHQESLAIQNQACNIQQHATDIQQHAIDIQEHTAHALLVRSWISCTNPCCIHMCRSHPMFYNVIHILNILKKVSIFHFAQHY